MDNSYFSTQNPDLVGGMIDALANYISNDYHEAMEAHNPVTLLINSR